MTEPRLLNIPVILGTARKGRASTHAAQLFAELLNRRAGVVSRVIDIATVPMPVDDAGEAIKDPAFARAMTEADGVIIVSPEYNHSFPGLLKHVLDSCLSEVHPQGRWNRRCLGRSIRWRACHSESAARHARDRPRHDLLGRQHRNGR